MSVAQATALGTSGLADVVTAGAGGDWEIRTNSKVGVVFGDDWELRVMPRLNVPRLMFLLSYSLDPKGWRRLSSTFEGADDIIAALATGFAIHATHALDRGLLRGYVPREEALPVVRGRVRFEAQIARGRGLPLPVHLAYDDFTEDILENRMLRTTAELLLRLPRVPTHARLLLQRVRAVLDRVQPLTDWRSIKAPEITRLNKGYETALLLAERILGGMSISMGVGAVRSTTFVFDMNTVFEDFVTVALRAAMRKHGGVIREQDTTRFLDKAEVAIPLKPDLAWWAGGRCRAVLDAKYKSIANGVMQNADAYQMLAYCTAYRLPVGYLIYAKDSGEQPRVHEVRNTAKKIVVATLDVEKEPDDLLADVSGLATDVARAANSAELMVA